MHQMMCTTKTAGPAFAATVVLVITTVRQLAQSLDGAPTKNDVLTTEPSFSVRFL